MKGKHPPVVLGIVSAAIAVIVIDRVGQRLQKMSPENMDQTCLGIFGCSGPTTGDLLTLGLPMIGIVLIVVGSVYLSSLHQTEEGQKQ